MIDNEFFIAIYTNECKLYCDEIFFKNLFESDLNNAIINIVDNSIGMEYTNRLKSIIAKYNSNDSIVNHLEVSRENVKDIKMQFLRNVTESVSMLRDKFLKTGCKYFIILESDVIPPKEWLSYFEEVIDKADIIGGIYYKGFHKEELFNNPNIFEETHHVLSGCTLYKRHIIEEIPFRWSEENLAAFPDAWMCYDANRKGYKLANYSKINCDHLEKNSSRSRGLEDLK